jgi:hypothetical protein
MFRILEKRNKLGEKWERNGRETKVFKQYILIIHIMWSLFDWEEWTKILNKVTHPDYENELGDKYFLRTWARM